MKKSNGKINLYWDMIDGKDFIFHSTEEQININQSVIKHKHFDYSANINFEIGLDKNGVKNNGEVIMFKDSYRKINDSDIEFIFELIEREFGLGSKTIFSVIKKIDFLFKSIRSDLTPEKIFGIMGELAFIIECEKNNFMVADFFHNDDSMPFDFYIKRNDLYLEVKSAIGDNKKYICSHKQVSFERDKTVLITANLIRDDNGSDLLDLLNMIKSDNEFLEIEILKLKEKIQKDKEILKHKINLGKTNFRWYEGSSLPFLKISDEGFSDRISDIKYKIDLSDIKSKDIAELISLIK
ncbi:PD-(D/E)XK motif protein [Spiroplasma alleghenense]|uniref:PD-(D/E)XK motif protein n=1 Tax=Spiroplasma alleghenense TaxID=216931 RepID=A0A345Z599_9MOLU|nr:PD-(D/E)XK motif protein [Spiroplasma alleghenense]AXK51778.1 hypothetical protein SALLE_v1c11080 [Spiroplasma alleghenense]